MSRRVLFDSSVYIQALRERRVELLQSRTYDGAFVHLSAVVTLNRAHFDLISEFRPVRILVPS